MRRNSAVVITLPSFLVAGSFLFPCWRWKLKDGDRETGMNHCWFGVRGLRTPDNADKMPLGSEAHTETEMSGWAFLYLPPTPSAQIEWSLSCFLTLEILALTAGALVLCRVKQRDKEAGEVWKSKWNPAGDSRTTLLRASNEPAIAHTLLRAAVGSVEEHPEELLRASQRTGNEN